MGAMKSGAGMRKSLLVFPALAIVVSVGCASVSGAQSDVPMKKSTTTTIAKKKKAVTTTTVVKGATQPSILSVLATIPVMNEHPQGYSRSLFKHWIDADGDGCDTREEVLIAESISKPQVDPYGCKVREGDWFSQYEGATYTQPSELDIDHMVPLKEAWDSGAWNWTASQRQAFANDLTDSRPLIAVLNSQNRSKSDKDPSNWIPPRTSYLCTYLANWVAIKSRWKLSMDQSEWGRIKNLASKSCSSTTIAPWGSATAATSGDTLASSNVSPTSPPSPAAGAVNSTTPASNTGSSGGVRQVSPVRCKAAEFGQTGEYQGIPYICSNTRQNGQPYATGYYFWRPA
jgi:hypothetical protein